MKHEILYLTRNDTSTHLIRAINFTFYEKLFRLEFIILSVQSNWKYLGVSELFYLKENQIKIPRKNTSNKVTYERL